MLTALGVMALCVIMAVHAASAPLVYWFGGWTPQDGLVPGGTIGIRFVVD